LLRELDDTLGIAQTLNNLALVAQLSGDTTRSREMLEECLSLFRRLEDKQGIARALMNLGAALRDLGDYRAAVRYDRESLVLWRQLGDKWDVVDCLEDLASVLVLVGEFAPAATIFGGADTLRMAIGAKRAPVDQDGYERRVDLARKGLGDSAFTDSWSNGSSMRTDQLIEFALRNGLIRQEDNGAL
jgi:tetratricopeptide (TPR) repeat protein